MRTSEKIQILTTDRVDQNGNRIPADVIDWSVYDRNPVLLYDKEEEGHRGVVVGQVVNRKRLTNGWAGNLTFMERFADADIAYEKYSQGVLNFVSIGGYGAGEEKDGVFNVMKYRVREFSLVKFPANMDCSVIDAKELKASERRDVKRLSENGKYEVRYLTMCVDDTINANLNNTDMIDDMNPVVATENVEETTETQVEATENVEETTETQVEASDNVTETTETQVEAADNVTETTETQVEAAENVTETIESSESRIPDGMAWHERNNLQIKTQFMHKTFKELNCDVDFQKRMNTLSAAIRTGASKTDALPENAETMQILATAMLADANMVTIAAATNFTDGVTKARKNVLETLIECAAGNAAAATLAAADLGVIKYLSMFFQKLLANDTFRRSVRFVPMSDRTGAIYIEDGVNAPTFVGTNTPINAPRYFYEDIKRTIARRVFSFSPITFQHSELAVLAYDKQSLGIQTTMGSLMQDISTYWLQIIANTPYITKIGTTGETVSTSGLFPIEAPNSNLTVKKPTLNDIVALEGAFLMQNYEFNEGRSIECVFPSRIYSMLAGDKEVRNNLTREMAANIASKIDFSATRITPRNPVARVNTANGNAELDPAMYADKNVNPDGSFTDITPATTTAQHVGAGVAFVANEVIAGVGSIELIVMPDPMNYGTTISGWVSTGATVARENGVGAALIVPTIG